MRAAGLDAVAVWEEGANGHNVRYLSGFYMPTTWIGGSLVLVGREGDPVLVTSAVAHGEPMHSNIQTTWLRDVRCLRTLDDGDIVRAALPVLRGWLEPGSRIGFAGFDRMPYGLRAGFEAALADYRLSDDAGVLKAERMVKTPAEIELLRRLGRITAKGMAAAMDRAAPGVSESEIAAAAHAACVAAGAEQMTFGCFAAAGRRGALKNGAPRPDRKVAADELVVIDLGCKLGGYQSDMSRNVVAGRPDGMVEAMVLACQSALAVGKEIVRPGARDIDVVEGMRGEIGRHGFSQWDWSICHGYGMELVEAPLFSGEAPRVLEEGMCFYIEPMIIPPHVGAVCIEDMVVVTKEGCEVLTDVPVAAW